MKKLTFPILAALILLTGCGSSEKAEEDLPRPVAPPTVVIAADQPSPTPEPTPRRTAIDCPYSSLGFEGRDVNAQHYPRSYSTIDAELISKIWNIISSDEREEVSDYQSWEDPMNLTFLGRTTERVKLQPDDYCELVDSGKKYALAPGSYSAVSALLTEYTTENYSFVIDREFLSVSPYSPETIEIFYDQTKRICVEPSEIGDFTKDWVLTPTDIENWSHTGRAVGIQGIYTNENNGPVEIGVYFDDMMIIVSCDGVSGLFYTDEATLAAIDSLIKSLEER